MMLAAPAKHENRLARESIFQAKLYEMAPEASGRLNV